MAVDGERPPHCGWQAKAAFHAYRGLARVLEVLPEPLAELGALGVARGLWHLRPSGRKMIERHLTRVLTWADGGVAPPGDRVRNLSQQAFGAYARYWVDGARLASVDLSTVAGRMRVEAGLDVLVRAMAAGRGVVLALPHVGSWEWGGAFLASAGYPMTSVAERIDPPELFEWFVKKRRAMGLDIVPLDGAAGGVLLKELREGGLVGLVCDRTIGGSGVEVEFFGERTTLPAGPATMALRTGATLLAAVVYSGPGRLHTGVVSGPIPTERTSSLRADVRRVTQAVASEFERFITRAPEQWHLFQPNWPSDPGYRAPGKR